MPSWSIHLAVAKKVNRKLKLNDNDVKKTVATIEKIDKNRKNYYEYHTKKKWSEPSNYDVTLNTASLGIDRTVDLLVTSFEEMDK